MAKVLRGEIRDIKDKKFLQSAKKKSLKSFSIVYNKAVKSKVIIYRNGRGKILSWKKLSSKTSVKTQKIFLKKKVADNYETLAKSRLTKIEDRKYNRPVSKNKRLNREIQSTIKYHVFIYQLRKGNKYKLILATSDFIIMDREITINEAFAEINEEVRNKTGYSLKEILALKLVSKNLVIEGGFRLRKFAQYYRTGSGYVEKERIVYDRQIDFSDL